MAVMNRVSINIFYDNSKLAVDALQCKAFLDTIIEAATKSGEIPPFTTGESSMEPYTIGDSSEKTPILTADQLAAAALEVKI